MFRGALVALAFACSLLGGAPAMAESRLETAVELWLNGDDAHSLPMLAEMAADGHVEARVLLAQIETTDLGPSPYRQSLRPDQARDLFRYADGSPFSKSWLVVEADAGNERAQALLKAKFADPDPDLIATLNRLGEHQATDRPTRIVALYGDQAMRKALAANPDVMQDLRPYLAYLTDKPEPRGDGLAALRHIQPDAVNAAQPGALGMAGVLALGLGYGDTSPDNPWRPAVEQWLMSATSTQPIADLCTAQCAEGVADCAFAFLALSGGYFEAIRIDSPLEAVIPQARFLNSPRARLMVLRRAALARTETNLNWLSDTADGAEFSMCALDLIRQERRKYR